MEDPVPRLLTSSYPSQASRSEQYTGQADTYSRHRFHKPHRLHPRRFKRNSISAGTIHNHNGHPAHSVPASAFFASIHQPHQNHDHPTGAVRKQAMLETERAIQRKERTFIGGTCAVCELSLEYKSSGEKVLQFECGHVAHEACLYEYIIDEDNETSCPECEVPLSLDSSRSGNILDLNKLSTMVQLIPQVPAEISSQSGFNSGKTWDDGITKKEDVADSSSNSGMYDFGIDDRVGLKIEKLVGGSTHSRNPSDSTGHTSDSNPISRFTSDDTNSYQSEEISPVDCRKHDYDLAAMETKLKHVQATKGIPRLKVTIRSEFPTMTRSAQKQSLTCLITVEVPTTRIPVRPISGEHPLAAPVLSTETPQALDVIADDLKARVDNWHGLDVDRFGPLRLHANLKIGRDGTNWQKLDCYLFSELLICVREKKATKPALPNGKPRFQLKGSILVRKHLTEVQSSPDDLILTMNLCVASLPTFRMKFSSREQLDVWRIALLQLEAVVPDPYGPQEHLYASCTEDEDGVDSRALGERPLSSDSSLEYGTKTAITAQSEYSEVPYQDPRTLNVHVPLDVVLVIPVSSSVQGLKIKLLRDVLRFVVCQLGGHDRVGLITFGSNSGAIPVSSMATKDWDGWYEIYDSIKPTGQKSLRADAVDGASAALDLLSQRKGANPIASIFLISDSSANETDGMGEVVRRAHELNASIYSFGLGQTHKPDNLIELSTRSNGSYIYVRDWMMLRECVAGCLGSLKSTSHTSVKLKLKIPEGSIAKFVKVSGALHTTKRSSGKQAEADLGDLRFGDKRDILVQLSIEPDPTLSGDTPHDHWESVVSGLTSIGGSVIDSEQRPQSVEEVPLIQADLSYGNFARDGGTTHLSHPSLLTVTLLPSNPKAQRSSRGSIIPPIPSHPSIVQRRMEMLTADMLARALTLTSKGSNDNAHRLLAETRCVLQGLGKGSLPPLPPIARDSTRARSLSAPKPMRNRSSPGRKRGQSTHRDGRYTGPSTTKDNSSPPNDGTVTPVGGRESSIIPEIPSAGGSVQATKEERSSDQSLYTHPVLTIPTRSAASIDPDILHALDADIESCLENIDRPAVFSHDARKAALQTIGVISSQRGYTFRTETESFWASRIREVKRMGEIARDWKMVGNDVLIEEM